MGSESGGMMEMRTTGEFSLQSHISIHAYMHTHNPLTHTPRSYEELIGCLIEDGENDEDCELFVDADWKVIADIKTIESVSEFAAGWRPATLYQLRSDPKRVCLYFGDEEYEGLDSDQQYTYIDGVLYDGDGDEIELVDPIVQVSVTEDVSTRELPDPELQEYEDCGGDYLSNCDDDEVDFIIGGDGDNKIVQD